MQTIEPYWQDEERGLVIYNNRCEDVLPTLSKVDLVLTDPPYNVGIEYGEHNDSMQRDEWFDWAKTWFPVCRKIARTLVIVGQPRLPDYALIEPWKWLLCWYKPAAMGRSPVGFCNWEPMGLWGDGGKGSVDVITAPIIPDDSMNGHPCPKPVNWAVGTLVRFPDHRVVCDPFMGIGTTLIGCKMLNKVGVGIEIEERYCEIAARRLENTPVLPFPESSPREAVQLDAFGMSEKPPT